MRAILTAAALLAAVPALADTDTSTIGEFNLTRGCINANVSGSRMFTDDNDVTQTLVYYMITDTCQHTTIADGGGWLADRVLTGDPRRPHQPLTLTVDSADPDLGWFYKNGQRFVANVTWTATTKHVSDQTGRDVTVERVGNNPGRYTMTDESHRRSATVSGTMNLFQLDRNSTGLLQWGETTHVNRPRS